MNEPRQFDGFCNACGGFRRHKLRCPHDPDQILCYDRNGKPVFFDQKEIIRHAWADDLRQQVADLFAVPAKDPP